MNDKFFKLPLEKQRRIINAAYKVFSENSYKKAPMSEIADESGISKALLFHYFTNKKELYLYLWTNAIEMTRKAVAEYKTLETDDFFEMLKRSLLSKCSLMREYPHFKSEQSVISSLNHVATIAICRRGALLLRVSVGD